MGSEQRREETQAECRGHESTNGPIVTTVYCDGSCRTTQAGAGASSDAASNGREAATRSGDAAPAPGKGAFISADEMTERLRERARRLMTNAARVHDRIGDGGIILGWRGLHIDLDEMAADIEAIRAELRR